MNKKWIYVLLDRKGTDTKCSLVIKNIFTTKFIILIWGTFALTLLISAKHSSFLFDDVCLHRNNSALMTKRLRERKEEVGKAIEEKKPWCMKWGKMGSNYCKREQNGENVSSSLNHSWEKPQRSFINGFVRAAKCKMEHVVMQLHAWCYMCLLTSWGLNWVSD